MAAPPQAPSPPTPKPPHPLPLRPIPASRLPLLAAAAIALTALLAPTLPAQRAEVMDGIAAIVNGDVITISQLRELTAAREVALRETYRGEELAEQIRKMRQSALQDLIDRQLILQEFRKREFKIPEHVVEERIREIILKEFGGDRQALIRTLQAQGWTLNRFREFEREKIIVQAMRQANVKTDFVITPRQIEEFYRQNRAQFSTPEEIRLRMIVLRKGSSPSSDLPDPSGSVPAEDKRALAEEIRAKILEGASFERMAEMYSEDPLTAEIGGDWGWITRDTLNRDLARAAFAQPTGKVSDVIQIGDSYYLLLVEERRPPQTKPLSEVKQEIEAQLLQRERARAQERWLETLRRAAFIRILT